MICYGAQRKESPLVHHLLDSPSKSLGFLLVPSYGVLPRSFVFLSHEAVLFFNSYVLDPPAKLSPSRELTGSQMEKDYLVSSNA